MPQDRKVYDVVALSALCLDIQSAVPDSELARHGLQKGLTNQVSPEAVRNIRLGDDALRTPGSPGGNVAGGIGLRGGKVALIGKIANDEAGTFITERLQKHDVDFTPVLSTNPASATNIVMVLTTPDRERSFAFASGAGYELAPEDIDPALIAAARITYLDSYLWLSASGQDALAQAAALAKQSGGKVAMALNDAALVARHQEKYLALALAHADILVGDRKEFMALFGAATFEEAAGKIAAHGLTAAITAGAKGADVIENGVMTHVPARKVDNLVDTNGAGDQFAAGFIYGLSQGQSAAQSAALGASWAADVIQHRGAEPRIGKNAPASGSVPAARPPRLS